jgi:hypothetical protein
MEERQRRACPGEHSHVDPRGELAEQLAQRRPAGRQTEAALEVPAGEEDALARPPDRLRAAGKRLRAVDQDFDLIPGRRLERAVIRPVAGLRVEGGFPAEPA